MVLRRDLPFHYLATHPRHLLMQACTLHYIVLMSPSYEVLFLCLLPTK
jgi:hypothetical protein